MVLHEYKKWNCLLSVLVSKGLCDQIIVETFEGCSNTLSVTDMFIWTHNVYTQRHTCIHTKNTQCIFWTGSINLKIEQLHGSILWSSIVLNAECFKKTISLENTSFHSFCHKISSSKVIALSFMR